MILLKNKDQKSYPNTFKGSNLAKKNFKETKNKF